MNHNLKQCHMGFCVVIYMFEMALEQGIKWAIFINWPIITISESYVLTNGSSMKSNKIET